MAKLTECMPDGSTRTVAWCSPKYGRCDLDPTYGLLIRWGCYTSPVVVPDRKACDRLLGILQEARAELPEHNDNTFEP